MFSLKKVVLNIYYTLGSQVFVKVSTAFLTILIARKLGNEMFGLYNFAISFLAIFSLLSEFGVSTLLTRDLAQDSTKKDLYFINTLMIKIILSILMIVVLLIVICFLNYGEMEKEIILLMLIATTFSSFGSLFGGIINGYQEMKYSARSTLIERITVIGIGLPFIFKGGGLVGFAFISIFGALLQLFYLTYVVFKRYKIKVNIKLLNKNFSFKYFKRSIPLGITAYVILFYYKIDMVLLGMQKGSVDVSYYSAAYMLINFLSIVPSTIMSVFFPTLSWLYQNQYEKFSLILNKLYKLIIFISLPISFATLILAPKIINIFFGSGYVNSVLPLQILIWTVTIMFFNSFLGNLAVIINKAALITKIVSITAIVNLLLNIIFIPAFSYNGSALITVISELLSFILVYKIVLTETKIKGQNKFFVVSLLCCTLMSIILLVTNPLNLFVQILLGILSYGIGLFLFKAYSIEEIKGLWLTFKKDGEKSFESVI